MATSRDHILVLCQVYMVIWMLLLHLLSIQYSQVQQNSEHEVFYKKRQSASWQSPNTHCWEKWEAGRKRKAGEHWGRLQWRRRRERTQKTGWRKTQRHPRSPSVLPIILEVPADSGRHVPETGDGQEKGPGNMTRPRGQCPSADPKAAENRKQVTLNTLLCVKKINRYVLCTNTSWEVIKKSFPQCHGEGAGRKTCEIFK